MTRIVGGKGAWWRWPTIFALLLIWVLATIPATLADGAGTIFSGIATWATERIARLRAGR